MMGLAVSGCMFEPCQGHFILSLGRVPMSAQLYIMSTNVEVSSNQYFMHLTPCINHGLRVSTILW